MEPEVAKQTARHFRLFSDNPPGVGPQDRFPSSGANQAAAPSQAHGNAHVALILKTHRLRPLEIEPRSPT
jgi:hypothetical protein